MKEILFLSAPLKERIWGSKYFKETLQKTLDDKLYGEMWSVSAHPEGESLIINEELKNKRLSEVYKEFPELFNYPKQSEFPILVKLIATNQDLSVQVHPSDEYSKKYENQLGKTEGWLILNCDESSRIVFGHNAKNKEELITKIKNAQYDELLRYMNVKAGEFYAIVAGTVHALGTNIVLLEIQQSSDVTYRIYDYDRVDQNGKKRQLHIDKAFDVITYNNSIESKQVFTDEKEITVWDNNYFKVDLVNVNGEYLFKGFDFYAIVSVAQGQMEIAGRMLNIGDSFIVTKLANNIKIHGSGRLVVTTPKE